MTSDTEVDRSEMRGDCLWNAAITDAEKMIQDAKNKITHLKRSVESFKYLRDCGEPFPGGDKIQADRAKQQP